MDLLAIVDAFVPEVTAEKGAITLPHLPACPPGRHRILVMDPVVAVAQAPFTDRLPSALPPGANAGASVPEKMLPDEKACGEAAGAGQAQTA